MSPRPSVPPFQQAAVSHGDGCLSGYLLPPLAVLVVGAFLAFFLPAIASDFIPTNPSQPIGEPPPTSADILPAQVGPLASLFTPEVQFWGGNIQAWAGDAGLDPNMLATVMQIESCGNPFATSYAGAMGLFQVMPFHFLVTDDPYNPDTNALRGTDYLSRSLETSFGDARLAFAGYNGGIGVIDRSEFTWAAETTRYAYWASGIYSDALNGISPSPRLEEWLTAGGASLCRQAAQRLGIENP